MEWTAKQQVRIRVGGHRTKMEFKKLKRNHLLEIAK